MPAIGMGGDPANYGNPSDNMWVLMSPLSGPTGSPKDAQQCSPARTVTNGVMDKIPDPTNYSTGALNTGIGYGSNQLFPAPFYNYLEESGFSNGTIIGYTRLYNQPAPPDSIAAGSFMYMIGGGRDFILPGTGSSGNGSPANETVSRPVPWGGQGLGGFGTGLIGMPGGSRDAGPGPAFTCFNMRISVTTAPNVANGAVIATTYVNRSGRTIVDTTSAVFGSNTVATPAP